LVLTKRTRHGLKALMALASSDPGAHMSATAIGRAVAIPRGLLGSVLLDLCRAGLVTSRPGRTGGYHLGAGALDVTLAELADLLGQSFKLVPCGGGSNQTCRGCPSTHRCPMRQALLAAEQAAEAILDSTTLRTLTDQRVGGAPARLHENGPPKAAIPHHLEIAQV
jgi:Rrf2 family protein